MPCEDRPQRWSWAWNATVREVPPVAALIAALLAGLGAGWFGQSIGQATMTALFVGVGTFITLYLWRYIQAPKKISEDQVRRLAEWRARYQLRAQTFPARPDEVEVSVQADASADLDNLWCRVEHNGRSEEAHTPIPVGSGVVFGGSRNRATWWDYPRSFGATGLPTGHYKATVFMEVHTEPVGTVEWDVPGGTGSSQRGPQSPGVSTHGRQPPQQSPGSEG